jgi:hypothetical protein
MEIAASKSYSNSEARGSTVPKELTRPRATCDRILQGQVGAGVSLIPTKTVTYPNDDNDLSSNPSEDAENTKREQCQRNARMIVGLFMLMLGVPPLLNALGNLRVQTLDTSDVMGLFASGLCFGSA